SLLKHLLLPYQLVTHRFHVRGGKISPSRNSLSRELFAHHTGHLQDALLFRTQMLDLLLNHPLQLVWNCSIKLSDWPDPLPAPLYVGEEPVLAQILQQPDQEERMALSAPVDQRDDACGQRPPGKPLRTVVLHLLPVQWLEP